MSEKPVLLETEVFTVQACKTKAACTVKLKSLFQGKFDLDKVRAAYRVVSDADIALVIHDEAVGDVLVHSYGELTFKNTSDVEKIEAFATALYERAL